jgi:hypothetical protein
MLMYSPLTFTSFRLVPQYETLWATLKRGSSLPEHNLLNGTKSLQEELSDLSIQDNGIDSNLTYLVTDTGVSKVVCVSLCSYSHMFYASSLLLVVTRTL